ncbi:MAG: glycosyltransferase family 2 protein [candidate division Zixibacteria bacterium]|nr:glycosyltransferase family 2 protein [candidate division Zixibacteria bacterium]
MRISAVIITKNEERNIARCLHSIRWVDEIIIVDSQSEDRTVEIAESYNAKIHSPEWMGYGPTKQYGIEQATGEWILSLDADEVVSSGLAVEIRDTCSSDSSCAGYRLPRLTCFLDRWIYHSQWYPDYVVRLFRRGRGRFSSSAVHEHVELDGPPGRLKHPLLHYSYPDLHAFHAKGDRYARLSAQEMHDRGRTSGRLAVWLRAVGTFYRHFILRGGFLDGWEGWYIAMLSSRRNYRKYDTLRELNKRK